MVARLQMWIDQLRQDARYARRNIARNPGFASAAILTVAVGIGANTAIFSVLNTVILRPLPYKDADRWVRIVERTDPGRSASTTLRVAGITPPELIALRSQAHTLSHVGVYVQTTVTLTGRGETVRLDGTRVSPVVLAMTSVRPILGRLFIASEEASGADAAIILSYAAWQRYVDGSTAALGQELRQAAILTLAGVVVGLAGSAAVTRYLASMLFGLTALDTRVFVAASVLFVAVATCAALVPARRATRVDPLKALRSE